MSFDSLLPLYSATLNRKQPFQPPQPWVAVYGSNGLTALIKYQQTSLASRACETGKLFFVGTGPDGGLSVFERTFDRSMGRFGNDQSLFLATKYQLTCFEDLLRPGQWHQERDRLFVPRVGFTTAHVDTKDVSVEDSGRIVFVATSLSCIGTVRDRLSMKPVWRPPFISRLAAEDRCHLNGLALRDGKARYVTAVSRSDVADGWWDDRNDGGIVMDITTNEIVCEGLSIPHSPRWYRDQLWVLNSGRGELGRVNLSKGTFEPLAFCPGYLRGLTFVGDYAVVSLAQSRHDNTYVGLPLDAELAKRNATADCGLQVIDLNTGKIVERLKIDGDITEIYDVIAVPSATRPMALGLKTDEIQRLLLLDEVGGLPRNFSSS